MGTDYDTIGLDYANLRRPDPRIAALIERALGDSRTVVNVGAGAGSYEPLGRAVTAVEPSTEMIRQRPFSDAVVVQGLAEALPFANDSFDAAMAVLTVHHWSDQARGLQEMRRVAHGPVAILTFDPAVRSCWLADYFPELVTLDVGQMPEMGFYARWLGPVTASPVPIPHDCRDGFLFAYWRRPEAYLEDRVRSAISSFWRIGGVAEGLARLEADLASGAWSERHAELLELDAYDCGYRLVVAS